MINETSITAKLILNQFGGAIFGIMLTGAAAKSSRVMFFVGLVAIVFYLYLVYSASWEWGSKVSVRVEGGRLARKPFDGLKYSFYASIPTLVLSVLFILGCVLGTEGGPVELEWAGTMGSIANAATRLWNGMYLGLLQLIPTSGISPAANIAYSFLFLLLPIPGMAVCQWGYYFGLTGKRIFSVAPKKDKVNK